MSFVDLKVMLGLGLGLVGVCVRFTFGQGEMQTTMNVLMNVN